MMRMTFFWTPDLGEFFFPGLEINTVVGLVILCAVVGLFSVLYEAIKVYSAYARARAAREQIAAVSCAPSESANLLVAEPNDRNSFSKRFCRLTNESFMFLFHNTIAYCVMLSVMMYSGWIFITVVFSMGLGYFFFGHISMKINMESIQTRTIKVVCSPACAEAGHCEHLSKTPSPTRTIDSDCSQSQVAGPSTSGCHENQAMCESPPENCQQKSRENQGNADENCCCRL